MLLQSKNAVVYGAGGAIGAAVASAFAEQGATVFLTGRSRAKLESVADGIKTATPGASVSVDVVDALDQAAVEGHADRLMEEAGSLDISFNAVGKDQVDFGVPLADLTPESFIRPIDTWMTTHFITATAAARRMAPAGAGVILTLSSSVSHMPTAMAGGFLTACAGIERLSEQLAAELGPSGVRVVCLRPAGILETVGLGSVTGEVWRRALERQGMTLEQYLADPQGTELLPHTVTLREVTDVAVFLASDKASGMTATVANVSCGQVIG